MYSLPLFGISACGFTIDEPILRRLIEEVASQSPILVYNDRLVWKNPDKLVLNRVGVLHYQTNALHITNSKHLHT